MKRGSQKWIESVVKADPDALFEFISENPPVYQLTYAAEAVGDLPEEYRIRAATVLLMLRDHPDRVVQEGATMGAKVLFRTWEFD